jgi:hypothetical protein
MYTPSMKTLGSFSFMRVDCSMLAAVWLTESRQGPLTTTSSPSTETFVPSPIILALRGVFSPMKFSISTSLPFTFTVTGKCE